MLTTRPPKPSYVIRKIPDLFLLTEARRVARVGVLGPSCTKHFAGI